MKLTAALQKLADGSAQRHPGEAQEIMKRAIDDLKETPILEKAYKTGDTLPDFTLPNAQGDQVNVSDLLKKITCSTYLLSRWMVSLL